MCISNTLVFIRISTYSSLAVSSLGESPLMSTSATTYISMRLYTKGVQGLFGIWSSSNFRPVFRSSKGLYSVLRPNLGLYLVREGSLNWYSSLDSVPQDTPCTPSYSVCSISDTMQHHLVLCVTSFNSLQQSATTRTRH